MNFVAEDAAAGARRPGKHGPSQRGGGVLLVSMYWNQIMAASLTVSVPIVVGFLLLQRFLVAGMTAGSVK